MNVLKKIFIGLIVLAVLVVAGVAVAIATVDINQYRPQIADALSKQTGRSVKLEGPIKLAVTSHGIGLEVKKAAIGNPPWASRPQMANIDELKVSVALMPLIDHQLVITGLDVQSADIQLETNAQNQNNWDMKPAGAAAAPPPGQPQAASAPGNMASVRVNALSIKDSTLAMRDKNGKVSTFKVEKLTVGPSSGGTEIVATADYNGTPVKLDLKTGASNLMVDSKWQFDADLTYANYHLKAQGDTNVTAKTVSINPYELSAGNSTLHGQFTANMGGAKSDIRGTVAGDKFDPADFKPPESKEEPAAAPPQNAQQASGAKPLFSPQPLDLSALKSANADIDVNIGEVTMGKSTLKQVSAKLALANGDLNLSPVKAMLGDSALQGDIKLEATSPAKYSLSFKAPGVDIASLLAITGADSFISGKGQATIELSGSGNSLHEMASNTNGHIDITTLGGSISSSGANNVASGLTQIFAPGNSSPVLNCVAARFVVTNGVGKDNGILADSTASTVAGSGGFNLGTETIDLVLRAKTKLVSTGGITPALKIEGPLASPRIGLDTAGAVQDVAGILLKNKLGGLGALGSAASATADNSVPALAAAPADQNACLYTLDHKTATAAAPAPANNAVKDVSGQVKDKAKDVGNKLMQGIFGH